MNPFPVYPLPQAQINEPSVSKHMPLASHGLDTHSLSSKNNIQAHNYSTLNKENSGSFASNTP